MAKSEILEQAKVFAVTLLKICDKIDLRRSRGIIVNQIVRSATSIGANVSEACYAASTADFINKLQIALKECHETEYWLELMFEIDSLSDADYKSLKHECGVIRAKLIKSIETAKSHA